MSETGGARPEFPGGATVVFGGSGGIGSYAATLIADRGGSVVVTYRSNADRAAELVGAIESRGGHALAVACDVARRSDVDGVFTAAAERFGGVTNVVCAQGGGYTVGPLAETDDEGFQAKLDTDVMGHLHIVKRGLPHVQAAGGGSFTAIVSGAMQRVSAGFGPPSVPKIAVAAMWRTFAVEQGQHGVRFNAVSLGVIQVGLGIKVAESPGAKAQSVVVERTPLRRAGSPEEAAEVIAFLASTRSSYVTGQTVFIDGGYSL